MRQTGEAKLHLWHDRAVETVGVVNGQLPVETGNVAGD